MAQQPSAHHHPADDTSAGTAAGPGEHRGEEPAVEVVRSEERLRVGRDVRVTGRAVLRRYVVTETVTQTFQVRREEVRLEHEPVGGDPDAARGPERAGARGRSQQERAPFSDGVVVETVLHREVPRVVLDVVPVERVRLHVDTVTDHVDVTGSLDQEQVVVEGPGSEHPAG